MAAGPYTFYNLAKRHLGDATINLGSGTFDVHLFQSTSNFATLTLSTLGSLTNQVLSANNYTLAGKPLAGVTWAAGASAGQSRFNGNALTFSAVGGTIANIKAAVIVKRTGLSAKDPANKLLCFTQLTTLQFSLTTGNTITINPSATGIFNLV